jgi:predicted nucleotidyltransferase
MADSKLHDSAVERFKPFQDEILKSHKDNIHSITIFGSALTDDFNPEKSDVNSVLVLNKMDLGFLEVLASLGKTYGKKGISAPLIMTPEYVMHSVDVFPIEFLNIKLLHETLFGEDLFQPLVIERKDLRLQCERELKVRLIGLRQGYISSMGDAKILSELFINTISGYIPLFRGVILLLRKEPPLKNEDVLQVLKDASGVNTQVFKTMLRQKRQKTKLTISHLNEIFKDYYAAVEKLGDITDGIEA